MIALTPIREHPAPQPSRIKMPTVRCPIDGCTYETPDVDPVIAAALITTHATTHQSPGGIPAAPPTARPEKVRRPQISPAGTTEDWQYFKSRWSDYVKATKLDGSRRDADLFPASFASTNLRVSSSDMSWFLSLSKSICISASSSPLQSASLTMDSV